VVGASDSPEFLAAYTADAAQLRQWLGRMGGNPDAEHEVKYLLQEAAGRREAFAELFAWIHGGGTAEYIDVPRAMPRTAQAMRRLLEEFLK
jgi:hypothetical protein